MKPTIAPMLNFVSIDYIRLATFDWQLYLDLSAKVRLKFSGWRKSRWLQYGMERSQENVSYGCGLQSGDSHGIFEASGGDAHIFFHWLNKIYDKETLRRLYATRIDLQSTKDIHPDMDYVGIYKRLAKPKQLLLGDDGNTIYIGNRESDSFWRIYDKTPKHVRLEVELKGTQAKKYWRALIAGESPAALYDNKLKSSRVPVFLAGYYSSGEDVTDMDSLKTPELVDLESKFLWLATLDSLVYKLANDHDVGDRTERLIRRWYEYTDKD